MEERRPVPDLSAFVRRQQRRWRAATSPASSSISTIWQWLGVDGIWLSPVTVSPECRLGLRRLGLLCHRTRIRDAWTTSTAWWPRPGGAASASSWTSCRTTPARSTRGSSSHARRAAPAHRDWYVWADGKDGRVAAQQLGEQLRRSGLDARRDDRPVLPPQPPAASSPTSTGGTRTSATRSTTSSASGPTEAWPASASTSCNVHHQGRRAPRQPAGDRGRRLRDPDVRPAQRLQRQPARGARRHPALASHRRRLRRAPASDRRDPRDAGHAGGVLRRRP